METKKISFQDLEELGLPSTLDYCREVPGEYRLEVYRGEMLCLTVLNSVEARKWKVVENSKKGPTYERYVPMPEEKRQALALKRVAKRLGQTQGAV